MGGGALAEKGWVPLVFSVMWCVTALLLCVSLMPCCACNPQDCVHHAAQVRWC